MQSSRTLSVHGREPFLQLQGLIPSLCSANTWWEALGLPLRALDLNVIHGLGLDSHHEREAIHSFMVTNEPHKSPAKSRKYCELFTPASRGVVWCMYQRSTDSRGTGHHDTGQPSVMLSDPLSIWKGFLWSVSVGHLRASLLQVSDTLQFDSNPSKFRINWVSSKLISF